MRVRTEKITPERAAEWLASSEGMIQRTLRKTRVEQLVHAIESGQWILTHQPIALDPDKRVLDGQHRLTAIVRAGIPVECLVAWDSDPASFGVIDTGAVRSQSDTLKIAGFHNTAVLAACVRAVLAYDVVKGTTDSFERATRQLTTADTLGWLEGEHLDSTINAVSLGNRVSTNLGRYGLRSSISAVPLIYWTNETDIGPDTLAEFFERLSDGAMLAPYSPILALRRFFIGETGYTRIPSAIRRPVTIALTIKAINDYALGRERTTAHWRHGVEPMPLPLSPGTREAESLAEERAHADREAQDAVADAAIDAANGKANGKATGKSRRRVKT